LGQTKDEGNEVMALNVWDHDHIPGKNEMRSEWDKAEVDIDRECTCNDCGRNKICEFRYDLYNYDGDCLWLK